MCSVFWLFWLSYQYLSIDWLERLLWVSLIVATGKPESPGRRVHVIFLVYCIASLFNYVFVLSPAATWYNYFPTFMVRYSLFVLKVPLNPKQTNKRRTLRQRLGCKLNHRWKYDALALDHYADVQHVLLGVVRSEWVQQHATCPVGSSGKHSTAIAGPQQASAWLSTRTWVWSWSYQSATSATAAHEPGIEATAARHRADAFNAVLWSAGRTDGTTGQGLFHSSLILLCWQMSMHEMLRYSPPYRQQYYWIAV